MKRGELRPVDCAQGRQAWGDRTGALAGRRYAASGGRQFPPLFGRLTRRFYGVRLSVMSVTTLVKVPVGAPVTLSPQPLSLILLLYGSAPSALCGQVSSAGRESASPSIASW